MYMLKKVLLTLVLTSSLLLGKCQYLWKNYSNSHLLKYVVQDEDNLWLGSQGGLIKYSIKTDKKEVFHSFLIGRIFTY